MKRWWRIGPLAFLFLAMACGRVAPAAEGTPLPSESVSTSPSSTASPGGVEAPPINWEYPLDGSVVIADPAEAQLPFTPIVPDLGAPTRLLTSNPDETPDADRAIVWVYNDPVNGPFSVGEALPTMTQAQLEQLASCQEGEVGCDTSGFSLVTIRGDVSALLIHGAGSTNLRWLEGGRMLWIIGPPDQLRPDAAVDLANAI